MVRTRKRSWLLVIDIGFPIALYYGLRALGVSDVTALLAGTVPALISSGISFARKRRTDLIGMVVILSMVGSAIVAVLGGDARLLLLRNAWISLPFAGVTLWSLRHPQPLCYTFTRAIFRGRAAILDRLWEDDPRFRHAWKWITVMWGIMAIIDAVVRIFLSYTLPIDVVPALDPVITIATIVALQIPTQVLLRRSGTWHQVFAPRVAVR
jgi:hypothetical protein